MKRFARIPAVIGLACLFLGFEPGSASRLATAARRSDSAELGQAGIARVDSLMEAGQATAAADVARRLLGELGEDPLYGWQIEGRLGLALLRAGQPAEALPYLENVIRRDPNDHVAHRNFAAALLALGRKGRALTEFQLVVELAPADYEARLEYGQVLAEFGDVDRACSELEVARLLCPACTAPDRVMAAALMSAGDFAGAAPPLRRLMERDPTPWARRNLAQALAGAGLDRELLDHLQTLPATGLTALEFNLGVEAEARLGEAGLSLASVGALGDPAALPGGLPDELLTDSAFWGRVSLNLLETGHPPEALAAADRAIELDSRNVVYRNNRVVILLQLGRQEEAAREWDEVLELDPSLAEKESE